MAGSIDPPDDHVAEGRPPSDRAVHAVGSQSDIEESAKRHADRIARFGRRRAVAHTVHTSHVHIAACDGYPLAATLYEPARTKHGVVVIMASSMGHRREHYAEWARFLARRGTTVVTFDYRGVGGSRGRGAPALDCGLREWGALDLAGVIAWATRERAPRRLVAVTHSIGGQILGFAPNHGQFEAVLAVGSQKGYWRHWQDSCRHVVRLLACAVPPLMRALGYLPGRLFGCDDLGAKMMHEWARWALHPDFVDAQGRSLNSRLRRLRAPILALSFEDDRVWAPRRAVDALLALYRRAPSRHLRLDPARFGRAGIGHSGFFETGVCPRLLWDTAAHWLEHATLAEPGFTRVTAVLGRHRAAPATAR